MQDAAVSAIANVVLLAGIPFLGYFAWQKWRRKRSAAEICRRAGLQLGPLKYVGYCGAAAAASVALLLIWPPPVEPFTREGSAQHAFAGLGIDATTIGMALLYGFIKTGFAEELLFRGLITGSLARRLPFWWANGIQSLIFLAPHLILLWIMPEMWPVLLLVVVFSLFAGWIRIRSESIVGPWILHASGNVTVCLSIAARTVA